MFPLPLKLNIELIDPAIESNDPGILGRPQLSSMNLSIELKSVSVLLTSPLFAHGEMSRNGSRGP